MTETEKETNVLMGLRLLHMKWLDRARDKEAQGLVGLANTYRKWAEEVGTQVQDLETKVNSK